MALNPNKLGQAIAEIRRERRLTQRDVAERVGLTVNYISLIENGERQLSLDALNRLAEVFKVPAELVAFLGSEPTEAEGIHPDLAELVVETKETIRAAIAADAEVAGR
jgi:transcriptional regulator with XRE-family HTH domain